jgi:hypothetical protein
MLNFTQSFEHQFNITLRNPTQGRPRLDVENTTISTGVYTLDMYVYENGTATLNRLKMPSDSIIFALGYSDVSVQNSNFDSIWANDNSNVTVRNSIATIGVNGYDSSTINVNNCMLGHVYALWNSNVTVRNTNLTDMDYSAYVNSYSVNSTINRLVPQSVKYWNLQANCSIMVGLNGASPNFTLINTNVNSWGFTFEGKSNVTITDSDLGYLRTRDLAVARVSHSSVWASLTTNGDSRAYLFQSNVTWTTYCNDNSSIWLYKSNITSPTIENQATIFKCWLLDVHVVNAFDQNITNANVTATNQLTMHAFTNSTGQDGLTRLLLPEQMKNATSDYIISVYTVRAMCENYLNSVIQVNITGDLQVDMIMVVIPELQSLYILMSLMTITVLAAIFSKTGKKRENEFTCAF